MQRNRHVQGHCPQCGTFIDAQGSAPAAGTVLCAQCRGAGELQDQRRCPRCQGRGVIRA